MPPALTALDHLVLTVSDINATVRFYTNVLGMSREVFRPEGGPARLALRFGRQKINLHEHGREFEPKADRPGPGTADLCFLSETDLVTWQAHLARHRITIESGPVDRTGATGPIRSLYIRDPDRNLIEIAVQVSTSG